MNMGEKIKFRRKQLKMSADALGEAIGKNRATIYRYEKNEIEDMPYTIVSKLAKALNLSPSYLMGWEDSENDRLTSVYNYFPISVSAGLPINVEPIVEAEKITIPDELLGKHAGGKNIYFTKVNGDSMNKIIPHDSLIAVKQVEKHQLKNGDIVVYSNGHDYAVKRFYDLGDKIVFKPESTDPIFTDYIIDKNNEDLRIHGKVIVYVVNIEWF